MTITQASGVKTPKEVARDLLKSITTENGLIVFDAESRIEACLNSERIEIFYLIETMVSRMTRQFTTPPSPPPQRVTPLKGLY